MNVTSVRDLQLLLLTLAQNTQVFSFCWAEINLWGNSDEEERVLQQVRKNFTQSKPDMPIHHSSVQPPPVKQSPTQAAGTTHIDLNRSPGNHLL